jgi:hypothetical protein
MPTRNTFNFANPSQTEQTFYENFMVEAIEIYGQDIYYMPRKADTSNRIWKEGSLTLYDEAFLVCAYLINDTGPTGAGILMTKFDVKIAEEFTFVVAKREFDKEVVNNTTKIFRPNEGDAIYFPLLNSLYQIKFVEDKKPFRQLNFLSTYGLISETFQYSDERFQTGVPEIDNLMQRVGYSLTFNFTTGTGNFLQNEINQLGEIVIGSISQARANVVKWDEPNKILEVNNVIGTFVDGDVITGFTSSASYSNATFNTIDSKNTFGDNQYIEDNAAPVVAETDSIFGFISRGGNY